ncbi:response regulator [Pseudarthrobacter sp. 1G09]|uniref:response regulator n=1 Tax=Pseudarthrobacter sp. 1G09 TaxID=3416178 RepID=UPI003CEA4945
MTPANQDTTAAGAAAAPARVLVVDDDPHLLKALRITLAAHGYAVDAAADGASALLSASRHAPDLLILDLGLPDMDGVEMLRDLRRWSTMPVLVLSARHGSADKVGALDAGADDYITKPFGLDELLARLRALQRRVPAPEAAPVVASAAFSVDLAARRVDRGGTVVRLTPTEWKILEILVLNPDRLITQQQLLARVWGPGYVKEANYLRVYMAQLRRKLETDAGKPRHLLTEPGIGYRFVP